MSKVSCEVCGKKVDSRGVTGHMRTHENGSPVKKPVEYVTSVDLVSWKTGYKEGLADAKKVA
jgi:hypothetical protein